MKNKIKNAGVIAAAILLCMSVAACQDPSDRRPDTSVNDEKEVTVASVTETKSESIDILTDTFRIKFLNTTRESE